MVCSSLVYLHRPTRTSASCALRAQVSLCEPCPPRNPESRAPASAPLLSLQRRLEKCGVSLHARARVRSSASLRAEKTSQLCGAPSVRAAHSSGGLAALFT